MRAGPVIGGLHAALASASRCRAAPTEPRVRTRLHPPTTSTIDAGAPSRRDFGRLGWLGVGLVFAGSLAGCIVAPVPYGRGRGGYGDPGDYPRAPVEGPVVQVPPPPPQYEVIPVAPVAGWIWIGGHWNWQLGRHVWIGGRWTAPLPGHVWVGPRWAPAQPGGWRYHGGYWRRH